MPKQQAEGAVPFSHTQHVEEMFHLYLKAGAGRLLGKRWVMREDLYAIYCAGYTEGVWTERVHPGMKEGQDDGR